MVRSGLRLARFHRVGAAVHAVALSAEGDLMLVGFEQGLQMMDRRGNVKYRLGVKGRAFSAVALSPRLDAGLAMERAGRLYRLDFAHAPEEDPGRRMQVAATGIWEQRDDLYSLDFAPHAGEAGRGLIALGHHALGLTALDTRGRLLWRLGPREGVAATGRTWCAAISPDCRTIYAAALGGATGKGRGEIVAVDAAVGKPGRSVALPGRVALLAGLPSPLGVAAVLHEAKQGGECCRVAAFEAELREQAWSLSCEPGVAVTAMAAAPARGLLNLGTNTGELWQVGAFTGRLLARHDLLFASTVLSVAAAESGEIAAGLANGRVAFLEPVTDER